MSTQRSSSRHRPAGRCLLFRHPAAPMATSPSSRSKRLASPRPNDPKAQCDHSTNGTPRASIVSRNNIDECSPYRRKQCQNRTKSNARRTGHDAVFADVLVARLPRRSTAVIRLTHSARRHVPQGPHAGAQHGWNPVSDSAARLRTYILADNLLPCACW